MSEEEIHDNVRDPHDLNGYITDVFQPCRYITESDDQLDSRELYERLRTEVPFDFEATELIAAMCELGFKKLPIEGVSYWLVKFA
jgi:hypothetical protein